MNKKQPTLEQVRSFYQYLRKQADNKKMIKYIEVTATFSLIAVFLFLAIQPTALAISSLLGEIKSKQLANKKMTAKINSLLQAQESFAQAQEKYYLIESAFPTNPSFYQSALNLASVTKKSSVNVKNLTFRLLNEEEKEEIRKEQDLKDNPIEYYGIDLSINSSYQQALSLIQDLAENRRLIDINSISFTRPKQDKENNLPPNYVNVNLSTNLFYSPINEKN